MIISATFQYDVFLSHSAKDKAVMRPLAERLRANGLKVWFDEWVLKPGDSIPAKIEEGLEHSRVMVLCTNSSASRCAIGPVLRSHQPLHIARAVSKFHISAITHRKDAVYPATIVGIPPMVDFYMGGAP